MYVVAAQRITLAHHIKGGMEIQADTLYRGLAACGHRVEIITAAHPNSLREIEEGRLRTHFLPRCDPRRYSERWWRASYAKLRELAYRRQADLLLSQSGGALPYIRRAGEELGLPTVIVVHMAMLAALKSQMRSARSLRGALRVAYNLSQAPGQWRLWRQAVPAADAVIVTSHEVAHDVEREFRGAPERIHVIPAGIDVARFAPDAAEREARRAELGLAPDALVAIVASRLVPEKGVQVALAAAAAVPGVTLLVAGQGAYAEDLQRQANALGLGRRARFLGYLTREALPGYLAAADLFLMPTLYPEGFPTAIVEALACGLPVVASELGGIPTAITHEQTGLLVPGGDAGALAAALGRLAAEPALRQALGAAARQAAQTRFSVERMVIDTLTLFERLLAARKPMA